MVMPSDKLAIAAALEMCADVEPQNARLVRIENTLSLRRMCVSEALLSEVEENERLRVMEKARPIRFGADGFRSSGGW